ncbi:MAG: tRNA lysidine(34) synthetase TilS [Schwartzia sp. (in: firmicutes)]
MEPMMGNLLLRVAEFVKRYALWLPGGRVLVACSGGADSLALLSLVLALKEKQHLTVWAAHFDHGIRGAASREDAAFVAAFSASRGIVCRVGRDDVPQYAARHGLSLEMAARERRYHFLQRTAAEMGEGAVIATGHHADDQAETVLMRILRGTGLYGLSAMRARRGNIVRPLLKVSRAEIEEYCVAHDLAPRQDVTNGEMDAVRNRIRLELMPLLREKYNPEVRTALCRLADMAQEAGDGWRRQVDALWSKAVRSKPDGWAVEGAVFARESAPLQEGLLRRLAESLGEVMRFRFAHYEALKALLVKGGTGARIDLPGRWRGEMVYGVLEISPLRAAQVPWAARRLSAPGALLLPALDLLVEATVVAALPDDLGARVIAVDGDALPFPWEIRTRRAGDWLHVEQGTKKLKNLFIDAKVPRAARAAVPLFVAQDRIFWVGGLRQAAFGRVTSKTKRILRVTLRQASAGEESS